MRSGLARAALLELRAGLEDSPLGRVRLLAAVEGLRAENALLREELRIKDRRLARITARERPHYEPVERLSILALRAAAGWSAAKTARRFLVTPVTIASWMRRLGEEGPEALVHTRTPVNRFPDFVAEFVRRLRATLPAMGKVRIAQVLARAGVRLAPATVARFLRARRKPRRDPPRSAAFEEPKTARVVTARYPHHLWHVDLTIVPTLGGFWIPWLPWAVAPRWPFAFWVVVVLDHFSRAVVAHGVFRKQPSAEDVRTVLETAIRAAGKAPRHVVTDQGVQFREVYLDWCRRRGIHPRFGAIGRKGSIAVVERFIRSMKEEHFRRAILPLRIEAIRDGLDRYVAWYNDMRPHTTLRGATPAERRDSRRAACNEPGFETRPRYPPGRRRRVDRLELVIAPFRDQRHLPVVSLRVAAY